MSYRRRATDGNHAPIGQALRAVTPTLDTHVFGAIGCDYIARHVVTGQPMLLEVKDPSQPLVLTENEKAMRDVYPGNWRMVFTVDDALDAVGVTGRAAAPARPPASSSRHRPGQPVAQQPPTRRR